MSSLDKAATKLAVLQFVSSSLLEMSSELHKAVHVVYWESENPDTTCQEELISYAEGFLEDVLQRLMDDVADV